MTTAPAGAPPLMPHRLAVLRTDAELSFFVAGKMPGLNELVRAKGSSVKTKSGKVIVGMAYGGLKKRWQRAVADSLMLAGIARQTPGLWRFEFQFREPDRKRNKDNIAAGARKFIFDALQECGVLKNDGWDEIDDWHDSFAVVAADAAGVAVRMVRV